MSEIFRTSAPGATAETEALMQEIRAKEEKIILANGLPFLFGWKWYKWAREFYESSNKVNLLCAANQISKSSTQIRKCLNWATDQSLWPALWDRAPTQFWYLYPSQKQVNAEFETKWRQFLPRNGYENDPTYGYKVEKDGKDIVAIHFFSGVHVYFKTYSQNVSNLQSGTVDAIFCDEELPEELYSEIMFRISASAGYFHMVFTATIGQDFWRRALEPSANETENLPDAWKRTISLYDAMFYEDGTPSHWNEEKIALVRARCSTQQEVLKRVYGKFIVLGGRKFEAFDIQRHLKKKHPVPAHWHIYSGVDIGSGGESGHPSAIVFVAVRPDYRAGRIFLGWRGDHISTTAGDVVEKYISMKKSNNVKTLNQFYDWSNKDFFEIANRMGETFEKAEKGHEIGEDVLGTLFKHDMLYIYDDEELSKLAGELASLLKDTPKDKAVDDFADALRYAVTKIPWDWSYIVGEKSQLRDEPEKILTEMEQQIHDRRSAMSKSEEEDQLRVEDELNEWNEAYGGYE